MLFNSLEHDAAPSQISRSFCHHRRRLVRHCGQVGDGWRALQWWRVARQTLKGPAEPYDWSERFVTHVIGKRRSHPCLWNRNFNSPKALHFNFANVQYLNENIDHVYSHQLKQKGVGLLHRHTAT